MSKSWFVLLSCLVKQLSLNSTAFFELWTNYSFGARLLRDAVGGLITSSHKPLDFDVMIVLVSTTGFAKVL